MMPKVALLLDRTATMAVRTPDLTFGDLAFNGGDRVFLIGKLYHAVAFCAHVIEVQDDRIAFSAVRTLGALQVFDDEPQVALPQGTALSGCPPVRIDPPRSSPQRGSAAVAIGTHELAVGDLLDDLAQPVALAHKTANVGSFCPTWSNSSTSGSARPQSRQRPDSSSSTTSCLAAARRLSRAALV
jgi:hypothetical protein